MPVLRNFCLLSRLFNYKVGSQCRGFSSKDVQKMLEESASLGDERRESVWATSPYPKGVNVRDQAAHSLRPRTDPKETTVIVFPGQGVQYLGMGRHLQRFPSVVDIFRAASDIVGYDVLRLCLHGPEAKLNRTDYQQIAVFVCSLAALEALKEEQPSIVENCIATAGFSLGEITALTFAEVFSFEQAVKLVKARGEAMQLAAEISPGAMLTVFFSPDSSLSEACRDACQHATSQGVEKPYCAVSNYLFPHCKIVAGHLQAIEYIESNKEKYKLKKVRRLPVSGAFHTPLMAPAVDVVRASLKRIQLNDPSIAVHSNVDGKRYSSAEHVKRQLPKQIVAPVKWEQTLHVMYERPQHTAFPRTFECGPGKSLSTILKMVNGKAWESCFNIPA